jgi:hypothetical protein
MAADNSDLSTNVRVICRARPMNKMELGMGGDCCVTLEGPNIYLLVTTPTIFHSEPLFHPKKISLSTPKLQFHSLKPLKTL